MKEQRAAAVVGAVADVVSLCFDDNALRYDRDSCRSHIESLCTCPSDVRSSDDNFHNTAHHYYWFVNVVVAAAADADVVVVVSDAVMMNDDVEFQQLQVQATKS